eukprot:CAMPEP_0119125614 /NCGR_PEP_ID=MMETSP1310-20130426/4831_1 /TAXON_ID=464262 /ORGANISM="Genus nov. species nov., Strain RCC2339" /LENGTH=168 /DNA_ID=CAMNT_0007115697 /DNA_START=59 /DNA_END=561 /DNA_ORIENTATION=+
MEEREMEKGGESFLDVTELFAAGTKALEDSEMVKKASYKLGEAMNAIEVMDEKVDESCNLSEKNVFLLGEATKLAHIPLPDGHLDPVDVVWLMDLLLAMAALWLNGQPALYSIHTILYAQRPESVTHPLLGPFLRLLLCTLASVKAIIHEADVADEEDFLGRHPLDVP